MKKPILLVIMDGVGFSKTGLGDAVTMANTPTLDYLLANYPSTKLKAHGTAVGLPSDGDMGNSEVGHNALGCGQVYSQGAKLVNESIESGKIYESLTWNNVINNVKEHNSTLHFMGLLSDGNVHSNISHLLSMLRASKAQGVKNVRVHIMLDGRDVPATSALTYVEQLETVLNELNMDKSRINYLSSAEIKKDEEGILELSKNLNIPVYFVDLDKLKLFKSEDVQESEFVMSKFGIPGVCEPSALITAGYDSQLIYKKTAFDGVTISVALENKKISKIR